MLTWKVAAQKKDNYKLLRFEYTLLSSLINLYVGVSKGKLVGWQIDLLTHLLKLQAAVNREYSTLVAEKLARSVSSKL